MSKPGQHQPSETDRTSDELAELKEAHRAELAALSPDEAQAIADSILHPRLWRIEDPRQLAWPGDLADDLAEDPEEDREGD